MDADKKADCCVLLLVLYARLMREDATAMIETNTLIIGAGPAGLAVAACLKGRGVPFILLEQGERVGRAWHEHYDRLHLHTSRGMSGLPGYPMPRSYPRYPSREQVTAYLADYAAHFGLEPHFNQRLVRAERVDGRWLAQTDDRRYTAESLVLATGYTRKPHVPTWPGRDDYTGPVLHSSEYRNGRPFTGQDVLVVGFGNSGGEIAVDLYEHGARPSIAVRSPVNIIPRDTLGISSLQWNLLLSRLPGRLGDLVAAPLVYASVGNVYKHGLRKNRVGPIEQIKTEEQVPLIDVGTVKLIKSGGCHSIRALSGSRPAAWSSATAARATLTLWCWPPATGPTWANSSPRRTRRLRRAACLWPAGANWGCRGYTPAASMFRGRGCCGRSGLRRDGLPRLSRLFKGGAVR
jgi:indole-3-pyruvate monooxygenase